MSAASAPRPAPAAPPARRAVGQDGPGAPALGAVRDWVFDLDNTLYPPAMRLFDQIEARMTGFVMRRLGLAQAAADRMRRHYWDRYGTTLAGLMREHGVAPEAFLEEVHDISFDVLRPEPALAAALGALPGRRFVFTNGTAPYARKVLAARGLCGLFDGIYGIEHAGYSPKPGRPAYERVFAAAGLAPARAAMFEDDPRNLAVPHAMGLACVHVAPRPDPPAAHVHHHTDDLAGFLARLVAP